MSLKQTVLILGGSGRFGRNATRAFKNAGWEVRQFKRGTDNLWDAAWGAQVIVNAWNTPPHTWDQSLFDAFAKVAEVAKASGATVIIPGNIYNYGDPMPEVLDANTQQLPSTFYGRMRRDIEAMYRDSGARTIVLRAGDFLDDAASGNWFDMIMANKISKGQFTYPGPLDVPHAWAFLPDMARAAVGLAEKRAELAVFEDVPYPGLTLTGKQMGDIIERIVDGPLRRKSMPWLLIRLLNPFVALMRYLTAMRYLWLQPHKLDSAKLNRLLPDHRDSPAQAALTAAIAPLLDIPMPKDPSAKNVAGQSLTPERARPVAP